MNCEKCQDLISDFLDGSISHQDRTALGSHLEECLHCAEVRDDLQSIVGFCRTQRGQYDAPPNERALWLRIRNMIEAGATGDARVPAAATRRSLSTLAARSWELSFPQLAAMAAGIILIVSLTTAVGLRRFQSGGVNTQNGISNRALNVGALDVRNRVSRQQQLISYWNQRVEYNKARWSPQMRETFDRNLAVIDQTVNESFDNLSKDPQDEVSEEMLNTALNEKLSLLKEFAEL